MKFHFPQAYRERFQKGKSVFHQTQTFEHKTMVKLQAFQSYFTITFIFGLNPYVLFVDVHKTLPKVLVLLPRLINIIVNTCIGIELYEPLDIVQYFDVFGHFVLIFVVCVNYVAIFENWWNIHLMRQILNALASIINRWEKSLSIKYPIKVFKQSLNRKIALQITVIAIGSLIKHIIEIGSGRPWVYSFLFGISNLIKCAHLFHLVFYIDFIKLALASLNEKVTSVTIGRHIYSCYKRDSELLFMMRQLKFVHFKLWRASQKINSLFGWFLVAFMCETVSTVIFNGYWEFLLTKGSDPFYQLPRKYLHQFLFTSFNG